MLGIRPGAAVLRARVTQTSSGETPVPAKCKLVRFACAARALVSWRFGQRVSPRNNHHRPVKRSQWNIYVGLAVTSFDVVTVNRRLGARVPVTARGFGAFCEVMDSCDCCAGYDWLHRIGTYRHSGVRLLGAYSCLLGRWRLIATPSIRPEYSA